MTEAPDTLHRLDTDDLRARSIRGGSHIAIAQVCKLVLMFLSQIILARLLNVEAFGLIAMVGPVLGFVQVFVDLGLMQSVAQRQEITGRQLSAIFWASILLSFIITLVMMFLAPVLSWMYGEPRLFAMTIALASLVFINGFSILQGSFLARQLRFGTLAICEVISLFCGIVAGAVSAYLGLGYWSLVISQAAITVSNVVLLWSFSTWRPSLPAWDPELIPMLKFGGNLTLSNLTGYLNMTLDNVMIGVVLGDFALGLYDRAWKLAVQPLTQVMAPVNRMAVPILARLVTTPERYRNAFIQMVQVMLLATTPGFVFLMLNAQAVIVFLFGGKWAETAPIFAWICVGAVISPLNSAIFWLFTSQGRARQQVKWLTIAALINVSAYAVGLLWGIVGVARLSAISVYVLQSPILFRAVTREGPVDLKTFLSACFPFAVTAVSLTVLLALIKSMSPGNAIVLFVLPVVSYAFSAGVLATMPSGRMALKSGWSLCTSLLRRGKTAAGNA